MIISSPVLAADRGDRDAAMADITNTSGAGGAGESGAFEEYGGVDPNLDPELAMVNGLLDLHQSQHLTSLVGYAYVYGRRTCASTSIATSR